MYPVIFFFASFSYNSVPCSGSSTLHVVNPNFWKKYLHLYNVLEVGLLLLATYKVSHQNMFYYISHPWLPSFPIELVKIESESLDQMKLT